MELLSNENFRIYNFSIAKGDTKLLAAEKYERGKEEKRKERRKEKKKEEKMRERASERECAHPSSFDNRYKLKFLLI